MAGRGRELSWHVLKGVGDPRYEHWLDIYRRSFPVHEKMKVGELNAALRAVSFGQPAPVLVTVLDGDEAVALLMYEFCVEAPVAVLWYLAVEPSRRSEGIGAWCYRTLVNNLPELEPGLQALVYEVEDPDAAAAEQKVLARRRIAFYERLGAELLDRDAVAANLPMMLMLHPLADLTPETGVALARVALAESMGKFPAVSRAD